ncbi:MAG: exodeoxyribonuclease V subunit gamma [Synechococcus sp.]|nr:exodeoxyribonuclease V subunit gamma [Synechococcus sp.]
MLTLYRSNRAELLAQWLAAQLLVSPPGPFETVAVVVNTWPTSRWLGEQLAIGLGGISANLRFPFPGAFLRQLVDAVLEGERGVPFERRGTDPWRASELVWPVLEHLPELIERNEGRPLRRWLEQRGQAPAGLEGGSPGQLDRPLWQLGRSIADAFDDYTLYRPALVRRWLAGEPVDGRGQPLPESQRWQPLLLRQLAEGIEALPFGLRVGEAIQQLRRWPPGRPLPGLAEGTVLRLFGISSMAPVQVELLQALSGFLEVEIYLLTPCRDLWQRRGEPAADLTALPPLGEDWLLERPRLEARFGRLGAEFQQLLEGSGETQLGGSREDDLFLGAASMARQGAGGQPPRQPSLLEQLQQQLVDPAAAEPLQRPAGDCSLEFHACPGRLRQVQIVRDRLLQLLAADPSLAPRDILVMTPQVDRFAPLVAAVFGDSEATGVALPWRLTDRSQQSEAGIAQALLQLLALGGERLTAADLEALLGCGPLLERHGIPAREAGAITERLQEVGFRWGLDGRSRGGDPTHSLGWAIDRLLLGLVLPAEPGLAPAGSAPLPLAGDLEGQIRWLALLRDLQRWLEALARGRTPAAWGTLLRQLLEELFGDGGARAWELPPIQAALSDWLAVAGRSEMLLQAPVVGEVLGERLGAESGRFGHRSGALTIGALEPMRAIPHRVIVLLGLDAGQFPRQRERPGFHLMERQRCLGDPAAADQDRYVLLESLLSARQHLLITWSSREERSGEALTPSTPVRQWLALLEQELGAEETRQLLWEHGANPLERRNFLPQGERPAPCSDRRLLETRRLLEQHNPAPPRPLATPATAPPEGAGAEAPGGEASASFEELLGWLQRPQECWLEGLGLRPREWGRPVESLEALALEEWMRARLLKQELEAFPEAPPDTPAPCWPERTRGQGVLPAGSAGALEAERLESRWTSLQRCLAALGEPAAQPAAAAGLAAELPWRGERLVQVRVGRPRHGERLSLWLQLLLAVAAGERPREALLVARHEDQFRVLERLRPPGAPQAQEHLETLQALRQAHRHRCWPVPPQTGWAYAAAEIKKPGTGPREARKAWEGDRGRQGEREEVVMALCFGRTLGIRPLLEGPLPELALALQGPLLEHWEAVKPGAKAP